MEWNLANLSFVAKRKGEAPILLFIESREMVKRGKTEKASPQYLASFKARQAVFYDRQNKGQIARSLFKTYLMDVTSVKEKDNAFLASTKAPIIALYGKDGTLKKAFSGRDAGNFAKVYAGMCEVMKDEGVDVEKLVKAVSGELNNLYRNELAVYKYGTQFAQEKGKYNKLKRKNSTATARLDRAQKKLDDAKVVSAEIVKKIKEAATAAPAAE